MKTPEQLTEAVNKCLKEYAEGYKDGQKIRLSDRMIKAYLDNPDYYDQCFEEAEPGYQLFIDAHW